MRSRSAQAEPAFQDPPRARPIDALRHVGGVGRHADIRDRRQCGSRINIHCPFLRNGRLRAGAVEHCPLQPPPVVDPFGPESKVGTVADPRQFREPLPQAIVGKVETLVSAFVQGRASLTGGRVPDRKEPAQFSGRAQLHNILADGAQRHPFAANTTVGKVHLVAPVLVPQTVVTRKHHALFEDGTKATAFQCCSATRFVSGWPDDRTRNPRNRAARPGRTHDTTTPVFM